MPENLPLVRLLVMIGALFWPTQQVEGVEEEAGEHLRPNGADHDTVVGMRVAHGPAPNARRRGRLPESTQRVAALPAC